MRHIIVVLSTVAVTLGVVLVASGANPWATPYDADVNHDGVVSPQDAQYVFSQFKAGAHPPLPTATPTSYCNLSGRSLKISSGPWAQFSPSFYYMNLDGCVMRGVSGLGMSFVRVTFQHADFRDTDIGGFYWNFADAKYADFTGAYPGVWGNDVDFTGANFTNANLSNSAFSNHNFTGAITTGANVVGATWNNTTCPDGTNSDNDGGSCIGHGFDGTPPATPTATATPCSGASANVRWAAGNNHCYQRFDSGLDFHAAEADCESRGSHLVTLGDAVEQNFVWTNLGAADALIGFTDEAVEGTWVWVTGEPVTYTNWRAGEPNNGLGGPVENAAQLTVVGSGGWNDLPVSQAFPYICETP